MSRTKIVQLSNGWRVKCRPVPSVAFNGAMRNATFHFPPPPIIDVPVRKGTAVERVPALPGSPEWKEYDRQRAKVEADREAYRDRFTYSYGVMSWSADNKKWSSVPPTKWKLDDMLVEEFDLDMTDKKARRAAFIMYDLLCDADDLNIIVDVIFSLDKQPVSGEEVQAAEDGFPGDVSG